MQECAGSPESEQGYHHDAEVWLDNPGVCPLKSLVSAGSSNAVWLASLGEHQLAAFLAEGFIGRSIKPY